MYSHIDSPMPCRDGLSRTRASLVIRRASKLLAIYGDHALLPQSSCWWRRAAAGRQYVDLHCYRFRDEGRRDHRRRSLRQGFVVAISWSACVRASAFGVQTCCA